MFIVFKNGFMNMNSDLSLWFFVLALETYRCNLMISLQTDCLSDNLLQSIKQQKPNHEGNKLRHKVQLYL